jgi:imidazolonepropionase
MRAQQLLKQGITTIEVKSGYGLNAPSELKMLRSIREAAKITKADLVSTCLAAHIKPKDFKGSAKQYLDSIVDEILPVIQNEKLSNRTDIYIDDGAFSAIDGRYYLQKAKEMNFDLVVHADQFAPGGLMLALELNALSADHLETTGYGDMKALAQSSVIPVLLPGSSLGLGAGYAPARKMLNAGTSMVIASDWNPGSAPMGKLLTQASLLGIYEKLTMAETLASLTCRAAPALRLNDRGIIRTGMIADIIAFPCSNYRDIVYYQGGMMPEAIWKSGKRVRF